MTWLGRCPAPFDSEHLPWTWQLWVSGVKTLVGLYLRGRPVAELRGLCKEQSSNQKGKQPRHGGGGAGGWRDKPCEPHPGHRQPGPSASSPASLMAAKPALQPGSCPCPAPRGLRLSPALLSPSIRAAWNETQPASVSSGWARDQLIATGWGGLGREENMRSRRLGAWRGSEKREWAVLL